MLLAGCQDHWLRVPWGAQPPLAEVAPAVRAQLDGDSWQLDPHWTPDLVSGDPPRFRWQHCGPRLDPQQDSAAGRFRTADSITDANLQTLAHEDSLAGWNAAILLARKGPPEDSRLMPLLRRLVVAPPRYRTTPSSPSPLPPAPQQPAEYAISLRMRCAAAEAWCCAADARSARVETSDDPWAPVREALETESLPAELRAELWRGLARRMPPRQIPGLAQALERRDGLPAAPVLLRRAAVEACTIHAQLRPPPTRPEPPRADPRTPPVLDAWPETFWNAEFDPDPVVRRELGRGLAVAHDPRALRVLSTQAFDPEAVVAAAALENLGRLRSPEALSELKRHMARREPLLRKHAVRGLAAWGPRELHPHANDEASVVRAEVARQLADHPNAASAAVLQSLLSDKDLAVQEAALETAAAWPPQTSWPLLLAALRDGAFRTRQQAWEHFRAQTGERGFFPLQAPRSERLAATSQLAERHRLADIVPPDEQPALADRHRAAEIEAWIDDALHGAEEPVQARARAQLQTLTAADVPLLERLLDDAAPDVAEFLEDDLLPPLDARYDAWRTWKSWPDTERRRRCARTLAEAAAERPLPRRFVRELPRLLQREQDSLVWRHAMQACRDDRSDSAAALAQLALHQPWPDLRKLGCRHLESHPRFEAADWLIPLLSDADVSVQIAALRAAARCGNRAVVDGRPAANEPGAAALLLAEHPSLRLEAAACLAILGDARGAQELRRAAVDENPQVRERAAQMMARSGRTEFVSFLIRLGWTERHTSVKRAIVDALAELVPESRRPERLDTVKNVDEALELWAEWRPREPS